MNSQLLALDVLTDRKITIQRNGVFYIPAESDPAQWKDLWLTATLTLSHITVRVRGVVQSFKMGRGRPRAYIRLPSCLCDLLDLPSSAVLSNVVVQPASCEYGPAASAVYPVSGVLDLKCAFAKAGSAVKGGLAIYLPSAYTRGLLESGWSDNIEVELTLVSGEHVAWPAMLHRTHCAVAKSDRRETRTNFWVLKDMVDKYSLCSGQTVLVRMRQQVKLVPTANDSSGRLFDWVSVLDRSVLYAERELGVLTILGAHKTVRFDMNRYADALTVARFCGVYEAEGSKSETGLAPTLSNTNLGLIRWLRDVCLVHFGLDGFIINVRYTPERTPRDKAIELVKDALGVEPRGVYANTNISTVAVEIVFPGGLTFRNMILKACELLKSGQAPLAWQREYVLGFLDGDGTITSRGPQQGVYLGVAGTPDEMKLFSQLVCRQFGWDCTSVPGAESWLKSLSAPRGVQLLAAGAFPFSASRGRLLVSVAETMDRLAGRRAVSAHQRSAFEYHGHTFGGQLTPEADLAVRQWVDGLADEHAQLRAADPDLSRTFAGKKGIPYVLNRALAVPAPLRCAGDLVSSPSELTLAQQSHDARQIQAWCEAFHYRGAPINWRYGYWVMCNQRKVGVVTVGRPTSPTHPQDGSVLELSRFHLLDCCPKNSESRVLSLVKRAVERDSDAIVMISYSDPSQGHTGTIYKAAGWEDNGESESNSTRGGPIKRRWSISLKSKRQASAANE